MCIINGANGGNLGKESRISKLHEKEKDEKFLFSTCRIVDSFYASDYSQGMNESDKETTI